MTSNKAVGSATSTEGSHECCMCGDLGFSYELFQCKACQFRFQHKYCSNLYPHAETYRICNWCLTQKEETKEKSQNSSNSSSSCKKDQTQLITKLKKNSPKGRNSHDHHTNGGGNSGLRGSMKLQPSGPIKKQKSLDPHHHVLLSSPKSPSLGRKRIITNGEKEEAEKIRRTRSEEISNMNSRINKHGITKQVFRNKVRRYKLLDEVSIQ